MRRIDKRRASSNDLSHLDQFCHWGFQNGCFSHLSILPLGGFGERQYEYVWYLLLLQSLPTSGKEAPAFLWSPSPPLRFPSLSLSGKWSQSANQNVPAFCPMFWFRQGTQAGQGCSAWGLWIRCPAPMKLTSPREGKAAEQRHWERPRILGRYASPWTQLTLEPCSSYIHSTNIVACLLLSHK